MPGLRVVRDFSGLPHLFALRRTARKGGGDDIEIVHAAQYRTGHPLTPWHSLGSPNAGDAYKSRETGFPAAGFDAAGGLVVFARNFGHSVSFREQRPEGGWSPWRHLSGVRVADELVTVTTHKGEVELLARVRDSAAVVRWHRPAPDGEWAEDRTVPIAPCAGSMAAGPEPGTVVYRDLGTGEPWLWYLGSTAPVPLGGAAGEGPVTGCAASRPTGGATRCWCGPTPAARARSARSPRAGPMPGCGGTAWPERSRTACPRRSWTVPAWSRWRLSQERHSSP